MKKLLVIFALILFPSLAFANGFLIPKDKYLDVTNYNILTTYKDRVFTQYLDIDFKTDAKKFGILIPVENQTQFSTADDFSFNNYLKDVNGLTKFGFNNLNLYDNYSVQPNIAKDISHDFFTLKSSNTEIKKWFTKNGLSYSEIMQKQVENLSSSNLSFLGLVIDLKNVKTSSKVNFYQGKIQTIKLISQTNRPIIYQALYNSSLLNSEIKPKIKIISISEHRTSIDDFTEVFGDFIKTKNVEFLNSYLFDNCYVSVLTNALKKSSITKDWVLSFSAEDSPINSNLNSFKEKLSWYFIFFAIVLLLIVFSPIGILFYYSSFVQKRILYSHFKNLYKLFQYFSFALIFILSILILLFLKKFEPTFVDNVLYFIGIRFKFSYIYFGTFCALIITNTLNILILIFNNSKSEKIIKKHTAHKTNKIFDIK
ncbi:MAG: hypothetical protein WC860_09855 [Candidatus Margulisiibacteriota bacterium]